MRLTAEIAVRGVVRALHDCIAPAVGHGYAGEVARLAELLLVMTADGMDDAVALRVREHTALRALFAQAAGLDLADRDLTDRLAAASRSVDPGLRISELDAESGRLRTLLVELHTEVELRDGDAALEMTRIIWRLLRDIEAARAPG